VVPSQRHSASILSQFTCLQTPTLQVIKFEFEHDVGDICGVASSKETLSFVVKNHGKVPGAYDPSKFDFVAYVMRVRVAIVLMPAGDMVSTGVASGMLISEVGSMWGREKEGNKILFLVAAFSHRSYISLMPLLLLATDAPQCDKADTANQAMKLLRRLVNVRFDQSQLRP